jgi:NADH pyrophosphatase NudC (nudix superfamily)
MNNLKVEGSLNDNGFIDLNHVDELCPWCGIEVFNIPASRVSLCPDCNGEIFPCSGCDS